MPPPGTDPCVIYTCNVSATKIADMWNQVDIPGCKGCPLACASCEYCTNTTGTFVCTPTTCKNVSCFSVTYNQSASQCCDYAWACDDNDPCTVDTCGTDGLCKHVTKSCDDGNMCTSDYCDAKTGTCVSSQAANVCNDNSVCTADVCVDLYQNCSFTMLPCETTDKCKYVVAICPFSYFQGCPFV